MFDRRLWPYIDWVLIALVAVICVFGFATVYSASVSYANGNSFFPRQLLWFLAGLAVLAFTTAFDYKILGQVSLWLHLLVIGLLVLTLLYGTGGPGSKVERWLKIGPIFLQPSEFAKYTLVLYLAHYFRESRRVGEVGVKELAWPLLGTVIPFVLILKQPDLGSTVLISVVVFLMMFIAGARVRHIGMLILLALPVLYMLVVHVAYRWARIVAFLDPWQDSQGIGFQLSQSQIALGSGGLFGVGLGKSVQKLFYLPAAHTDFILSIIGEEFGFVGAFTVVTLFILFIWQGARVAKRTTDLFGYYLAVGIVSMVGLQAAVNIGVSIGALPTKGIPAPFISYGGSNLMMCIVCVGLLLSIAMDSGAAKEPAASDMKPSRISGAKTGNKE